MFHGFSEKVISFAAKNKYISQEEFEEYTYGFELILSILLTDITVLLIGLLMNMLVESIVFWVVYKILRKYTGGFHFDSGVICYLSSCIMGPIVLLIIRYCPYDAVTYSICTAASLMILFLLSPIEAIQKPLDDTEKKVFGKWARILISIAAVVFALCVWRHAYTAKILAVSIMAVTLFAIMGKIKLMYYKNS